MSQGLPETESLSLESSVAAGGTRSWGAFSVREAQDNSARPAVPAGSPEATAVLKEA